jgi:gliding motility-associated-like protein
MRKSTKFHLSLLISVFTFTSVLAKEKRFAVSGDVFGKRVIIENKGQFSDIIKDKTIQFAYDNFDEGVFFHQNSLTYRILEHFPITEEMREKIEHGKRVTPKPDNKYFVNVSWKNSNPNIVPTVEGLQNHYQSYGDAIYKSNCYKKLVYKNVYNKIDVEYTFTNERMTGIKYNVILKPGANLSDYKMNFNGDVKSIKIRNNELQIKTPYLTVKELSPVAIQNGKKLACNFILNDDNTVSFQIPNGYDPNQELIIDPWVVNLALTTNNYGYDVDYDYFGNYYVYGGTGPFLICRYTPAGTLQWTFNGTVPSQSWTSLGNFPSGQYVGNFVVDKITGKSYTGEGFNSSVGTRIVRIDAAGVYDNFISTGNSTWNEVWDMNYDCAHGTFFGLGGSTSGNVSAGILNTVSGAITPQSFTGLSSSQQDIVSSTIDPQGNIFFIYASVAVASINNYILRVNAAFNGNVWISPSTYATFAESDNKHYPGSSMPLQYSNGFNALAASTSYLYYYDGMNLAAYNKATGAKIGSVAVAGLTVKQQGGIAVDACDNVYIGGNGSILSYNFNGTTFSSLPSIALGVATANKYVTDIKYYEANNELYVSGSGFGGIYSAVNSLTCTSSSCTLTPPNCSGVVSASVTTGIVSPVFNYSFTNSTNSVVASFISTTATTVTSPALATGNYTLFVQINAPCGPIITQTFNVSGSAVLSPSVATMCAGVGITTTLSLVSTSGFTPAPTSYSWTGPGGFTASTPVTVNNNAAVGIYTITASNGVCAGTGTVAVVAPSIFTPNITSTNVTCFNGSDGGASLTTITGTSTPPYSYNWSTSPPQNTSTANNLIAGTYTLFVTDSNACTFSNTVTITQPANVIVSPTNTGPYCVGNSIQLNVAAFTTYTWSGPGGYTSSSQNPLINNAQLVNGGQYTVNISNAAGCLYTGMTTVIVNPGPTPNIVTNSPICVGDILNLTGTGGNTYLWNGPNGFMSSVQTPTVIANTVAYSGTYSLTIADINGCMGSASVNVIVNPSPTATITAINNTGCSPVCTSFTVAGTGIVSANWTMGDGSNDVGVTPALHCYTTPGIYTVSVIASDLNGCTGSNTNTVEVYPVPIADFNHAPIKPILNIDQEVTFTDASWGANVVSWNWYFMNTAQYTSVLQNPTFMYTEPGTYPVALVVKSDKGCMDTLVRPLVVGEDYGIYVPNAFTPNADGLNDIFQPKGFGVVKYEINVYDRWGEKVYTTKNFDEGWNGTFQGRGNKIMEEGTYTWLINLTDVFGKSHELKGHVILMK